MKVLDAHFETYLLEKSRLIKISPNERNYHIFYQLILGLNKDEKKYCLQNLNYYNYLNYKEEDEFPDDKKNFNNLKDKLKEFLSKEEIDDLFIIISGILYLGNIKIEVKEETKAYIKEISMENLKQASTLFGLKEEKLKEILTNFSSGKKTKNIEDTEINRDFISKELYSKLFNYLIGKLNKKMENNINKDDTSYRIGILDIFGFENSISQTKDYKIF